MNIGTNGSFVLTSSAQNISNLNYWIANNTITANSGAAGWSLNVDTASQAGKLVVTAVSVPEPSTLASLGMGLVLLVATRGLRKKS